MMDVVPLGVIPEISLSNKDLNYGIDIERYSGEDRVSWIKIC